MKQISKSDLPTLCAEIREYFIETILKNGGHFSANLGVVELTVALHYVFDFNSESADNKLVWDVGHQAYIHKLLTGRKAQFDSIRKLDGLSGFPKIDESPYDHFGTGHSSTSISAILGMAEAALLNASDAQHVAVIGDGSLSGGMAFEALNNLGTSKSNVLVIVNDNQIGIDPNNGAIHAHLNTLSENDSIFGNLNLNYQGPFDGHDVTGLVDLFEQQKHENRPRIIHIKTLKGKGHKPAEEAQTDWHSVSYVKIDPLKKETRKKKPLKFQDVFGLTLLELAEADENVIGITPAMPSGSSMKIMMDKYPDRVFDVGIAEQHAVTFAAGLTQNGKRPFCAIYSSFAQRAYDQVIHDVALQNLPVVFCIDRAGLVGADGPTHHGVFDLAFLTPIPNLTILSPMNEHALRSAMYWAKDYTKGPVVIRYPRGRGSERHSMRPVQPLQFAKSIVRHAGNKIAVLSVGSVGVEVERAIAQNNLQETVTHIDAMWLKPLDLAAIGNVFSAFDKVITVEEACLAGGYGQQIKALAFNSQFKGSITCLGLPDEFVEHGQIDELRAKYGLDANSIANLIQRLL